jgi:hypothetical protein
MVITTNKKGDVKMKTKEKKLTTSHYKIYEFLKENCIGKKQAVSMYNLSIEFMISEREVRQVIKDLTEDDNIYTVFASCSKGYYIPSNESEMNGANNMLKSRLKGALTRYFANTPNERDWLYSFINELKELYDTPPQAQQVIKFKGWEKDINYFGERKDEKSYKDLFEFSQQKV